MTTNSRSNTHTWRVIGKSVLGASHKRSGMPNQDAIKWLPESRTGPPIVLAVADGHGSQKHTESDKGAQFAVEIAASLLIDFLEGNQETDPMIIKRLVEKELPIVIERSWKKRVDQDIKSRSLITDDTVIVNPPSAVTPTAGLAAMTGNELDPKRFVPYGSTLLAVGVTNTFFLYMQLGDGDILTVSPSGDATRVFPKDKQLIANETTSLCLHRAQDYFHISFEPVADLPPNRIPALILVATDGYANSFQDEEGFLKAGKDYLETISSQGLDRVEGWLEKWLTETSEQGSGDDITLGIIRCVEDNDRDSIIQKVGETEKYVAELTNQTEQIIKSIYRLKWGLVSISLLLVCCMVLALSITILKLQNNQLFQEDAVSQAFSPTTTSPAINQAPEPADKLVAPELSDSPKGSQKTNQQGALKGEPPIKLISKPSSIEVERQSQSTLIKKEPKSENNH